MNQNEKQAAVPTREEFEELISGLSLDQLLDVMDYIKKLQAEELPF